MALILDCREARSKHFAGVLPRRPVAGIRGHMRASLGCTGCPPSGYNPAAIDCRDSKRPRKTHRGCGRTTPQTKGL